MDVLNRKGIVTLNQSFINGHLSVSGNGWISQLGLHDTLCVEWDNYILGILWGGIYLLYGEESLFCSWNVKLGIINANMAYDALLMEAKRHDF